MSDTIYTVHPADGDFLMTFEEAQRLGFEGIPDSDTDQEFFRADSFENPVNYEISHERYFPPVK